MARTDPGFDLTALLNGFRPLFEVLQPADVNRLATSMVQVLQGEGGTVEQLLQQTTELTGFLADRDDLYGQVVDNLVPVLDNLSGQDAQITATIRELKALDGRIGSRPRVDRRLDRRRESSGRRDQRLPARRAVTGRRHGARAAHGGRHAWRAHA